MDEMGPSHALPLHTTQLDLLTLARPYALQKSEGHPGPGTVLGTQA